ncbi:MAG: D-sedoheptulose-7-phosphate isomerase [Planctomycetota bacterium]
MLLNKNKILENFENILNSIASDSDANEDIKLIRQSPEVMLNYAEFINNFPELSRCLKELLSAHNSLVSCFNSGKKLLICGNGGSFADALHLSGELLKSFARNRTLSDADKSKYTNLPFGKTLAENLEYGFPAVVLGANQSLSSAVLNDSNEARLVFAQECHALGKTDDVLLCLSTSGNAENLIMAQSVARANGVKIISFCGRTGGKMAEFSDITILSPGESTPRIQEYQVKLYHALCAGVEAHFHPEPRKGQ